MFCRYKKNAKIIKLFSQLASPISFHTGQNNKRQRAWISVLQCGVSYKGEITLITDHEGAGGSTGTVPSFLKPRLQNGVGGQYDAPAVLALESAQ